MSVGLLIEQQKGLRPFTHSSHGAVLESPDSDSTFQLQYHDRPRAQCVNTLDSLLSPPLAAAHDVSLVYS